MATVQDPWIMSEGIPELVTVVIPTLDRGSLLDEAIRSVSEQVYRPIEVVVVDNGSSDDTAQRVRAWEKRTANEAGFVVRFEREEERGAGPARNHGIRVGRGAYFQFLDSDDLLLPSKLEESVRTLQERPEMDYAYGVTQQVGRGGKVHAVVGEALSDSDYWENVPGHHWHTSGPVYRRSIVLRVGPWASDLAPTEDWEYAARVKAISQSSVFVDSVHSIYRIHDGDQLVKCHPVGYARTREVALCRVAQLLPAGDEGVAGRAVLAQMFITNAIRLRAGGASDGCLRCVQAARSLGGLDLRARAVLSVLPLVPPRVLRSTLRLLGR